MRGISLDFETTRAPQTKNARTIATILLTRNPLVTGRLHWTLDEDTLSPALR